MIFSWEHWDIAPNATEKVVGCYLQAAREDSPFSMLNQICCLLYVHSQLGIWECSATDLLCSDGKS
jgi:hypothetical protein